MFEWTYSGVDGNIPGNGGPECANFSPLERRLVESFFVNVAGVVLIYWGLKTLKVPDNIPALAYEDSISASVKRVLLAVLCLTFGCEVGFKLATNTVIYFLNPCHVVTMMQIFVVAAPPGKWAHIVFRISTNSLNGAVLALLWPVVNTRNFTLETEVYYMQHLLILIVPLVLTALGSPVYQMEPLADFSCCFLALGFILIYHFSFLLAIGLNTEANLNNMLCPAISDPFFGPNYRVWGILHQSLLILFLAKTCLIIARVVRRIPVSYWRMIRSLAFFSFGGCCGGPAAVAAPEAPARNDSSETGAKSDKVN